LSDKNDTTVHTDYDSLVEHVLFEMNSRIVNIHDENGEESVLCARTIKELAIALRILTDAPYENMEEGGDPPE
jgi:hypothetical protein